MKKILWVIFTSGILFLTLTTTLLLFVQSRWAKDKIVRVLEEMALQQGMRLKIGSLEGELPLKWTLSSIHLELNTTDVIDIDVLRLRLSLLPLLHGKMGISYLSADRVIYHFAPREQKTSPFFPPPLSIRSCKIREFEAVNTLTQEKGVYTLAGNCHFKKYSFDLYAKAGSPDVNLELFVQGSQKSHQISSSLKLDAKSKQAFAPFAIIPQAPFHLDAQGSGPWETWMKLFSAEPTLKPIQGAFQLHQSDLSARAQFSLFSDRAFDLHSLSLKSHALTAQGNASFNNHHIPTALQGTFHIPKLSLLATSLTGSIQGNIDFAKNSCQLSLSGEKLGPFTQANFSIKAHTEQNVWVGEMQGVTEHPELGFEAKAKFRFNYPHIELQTLSLQGPQILLHGDLSFDLEHLQGGLTFQLNNLAPLSPFFSLPLAGKVGGTLDFQGDALHCHALAKGVKAGNFLARDLRIDIFATDFFKEMKGRCTLEAHHAYLADIFFDRATANFTKDSPAWNYHVQAQGEWKKPFSLQSAGDFAVLPGIFRLSCTTLTGHLLQKNVTLEEPFVFTSEGGELLLTNFKMNIAEGYFRSALQATQESSRVLIQAEHFPLDFLTLLSPRLTFEGLASCDIDLAGTNSDLTGHFNLLLEHADILPAGTTTPIQTKASLQGNLHHDTLQLHSHIVATDSQVVDLSLTLPLSYQLSPWYISVIPHKNFAGHCTIEGNIEQLFDFINMGSHHFGGFLSSRLIISGSLEKPSLHGPLEIQQGFYQNDLVGISLKEGHIQASAEGNTLLVSSIEAQDGKGGEAKATAIFHLDPLLPFKIEGTIAHFQVIEFDWLAGSCSGPFTISGNLEKGLIAGTLTVDKATINIPDQLPSEAPSLPVTFLHLPEALTPTPPSPSYPFHYDLQIDGNRDIHLSGRGLETELTGSLHLLGKNLDAVPIGTLQSIKGNFYFAGKDFKISSGEIVFSEGGSFLNMAANLELPAISSESDKGSTESPALVVTLRLRGALRNPELTVESNPPLPTSTLFARILFNKDVGQLSAPQIVQLANTLMTLSSAPDFLGTLRRTLGVDRLSISTTEEGGFSVEIGKSISTEILKGVAATLTQETENSQIKVEVELKGGFILQGETQADDQGKFSFKWNKNY